MVFVGPNEPIDIDEVGLCTAWRGLARARGSLFFSLDVPNSNARTLAG